MKSTAKLVRFLSVGLIILVGIGCMSIFAYWISLEVDKNGCYEYLGKSLNVTPTFDAVESVIVDRIQKNVVPGLSHDEVMAEFAKIAPPSVGDKWSFSDGEIAEFVSLDTCFFTQNDIEFLTVYLKDGKLKSVRRYVDK